VVPSRPARIRSHRHALPGAGDLPHIDITVVGNTGGYGNQFPAWGVVATATSSFGCHLGLLQTHNKTQGPMCISGRRKVIIQIILAHGRCRISRLLIWLTSYLACSTSFFSQNSIFLSQQFSPNNVFQPVSVSFRPANGMDNNSYKNNTCLLRSLVDI
jgi:hypothetical protein